MNTPSVPPPALTPALDERSIDSIEASGIQLTAVAPRPVATAPLDSDDDNSESDNRDFAVLGTGLGTHRNSWLFDNPNSDSNGSGVSGRTGNAIPMNMLRRQKVTAPQSLSQQTRSSTETLKVIASLQSPELLQQRKRGKPRRHSIEALSATALDDSNPSLISGNSSLFSNESQNAIQMVPISSQPVTIASPIDTHTITSTAVSHPSTSITTATTTATAVHIDPVSTSAHQNYTSSINEWVRLTVKDTDDPTLSAITIRSITLCILLGAMRQIVREYVAANASWLGSSFDILAIILAYPLGCLMANYLPARKITLYTRYAPSEADKNETTRRHRRRRPQRRIRVSLNPGPFNIKEYGCIAVFIGAMLMRQSMIDPISMVPVDILREITSLAEPYPYLLILSCHLIALGLATLLHYAIVQPSSMVYYQVLPKVAILQYLATQSPPAKTPRRWLVGLAGVIAAVAAAASAMVPLLDAVAPLCYITKSSVILQQLGSGDQGLGLLSFSTNWRTITSALGSPLAMPFWAIVNLAVGFVICAWVLIPIAYSVRAWNAQKFPIYSAFIYNDYGTLFDRQSILPNGLSSSFYSPQFTVSSVIFLAFSLAASTSVLSHFWLYHRRVFLQRLRGSKSEEDAGEDNGDGADAEDIHMRLIRRYPIVPAWWGITVLAVGLLLAAILSFAASTLAGPNYIIPCSLILGTVFLAPIATIAATTGFVPSTHLLFAILPTFFNPGSLPVNAVFHVVGTTLITSTVVLFMNAKLAHYLKIPPRTMFLIQLGGLSYSAVINAISTFLVIATRNDTVRDISICDSSVSYAWQSSCLRQVAESEHYLFLATYNPIALLGLNGTYRMFLTLFALGFLLPFIVYFTMRLAAPRKWRRYHGLICVPLFLGAAAAFPMNPSSAFLSWFVVGVVASRFLYKRFTAVWAKYVMVIALVIVAGYAVGVAIAHLLTLKTRDLSYENFESLMPSTYCSNASIQYDYRFT